jgi:copper(I)-binding protein
VNSPSRTLNEEAFAVIRASSGKTAAGRLLLGAGVLALLIPAIAGCEAGSDAPTLEFHAASSGAQTVFNGIRITNAFVLGAPAGSTVPTGSSAGLFVSLYNGNSSSDTLLSVKAAGTAPSIALSGGTVTLPADDAPVNLTGPQPKVVLENLTSTLSGGSNIPVTFTFAHAGSVTLQVPVEPQSFQWATFSPPAATPSASASATPSTTGSATPSTTGSATPSTTGSATPSTTGSATP